MAIVTMGNDAIDRNAYFDNHYTLIDLVNPAPKSGTLISADFYMNLTSGYSGGTTKVKVFRDDGTNYVYVGGSNFIVTTLGLNTVSLAIPVLQGDFIGFYSLIGDRLECSSSGGSAAYYTGLDVITDIAKTSWSSSSVILSIKGSVLARGMIIE